MEKHSSYEKPSRKSGNNLAKTAVVNKTRKTLKSFINKDVNLASENYYSKEEKSNPVTLIQDCDGKLVSVNLKEWKKSKRQKK
jgi:hypothetical protein